MVDLDLRPGSHLPVYCTSMGKVLLANLPGSEQRNVIGNMTLARSGPNSITSKKALRTELEHVHEEGMAVNDEEFKVGQISIVAPVRDESRDVVAAVDMAAHSSIISVEEMANQLQAHLLATADEISARLGYRCDDEATR
jgi:IclR family pca regulon transcriptional regulator